MSVFTSLIIILLAMVIQAFLQLSPGLFACFYHHTLGKTSAKKADDCSLSFILGVEICIAVVFLVTYYVVTFFAIDRDFINSTFLWIMAGIFLAESLFAFFFYYRPFKSSFKFKSRVNSSTELFLPRPAAKNLIHHAEQAKNRSDTIALGLVSCACELFLTLPLYIICSVAILNIMPRSGFVFIIAYIVVATVPLFTIRTLFRTDHNLAEIQRSRATRKTFTRLILSLSFLIIAILTFTSGVSQ